MSSVPRRILHLRRERLLGAMSGVGAVLSLAAILIFFFTRAAVQP